MTKQQNCEAASWYKKPSIGESHLHWTELKPTASIAKPVVGTSGGLKINADVPGSREPGH